MKKYKTEVYIEAHASNFIGEVEFDSIEEFNEKANKLWEEQGYDAPSTNITNDFDLGDWDLSGITETDLKYCETKG